MNKGGGRIKFGIYACSPEDSSFKAVFTDMKFTECQWKAHNGQQPDERPLAALSGRCLNKTNFQQDIIR